MVDLNVNLSYGVSLFPAFKIQLNAPTHVVKCLGLKVKYHMLHFTEVHLLLSSAVMEQVTNPQMLHNFPVILLV